MRFIFRSKETPAQFPAMDETQWDLLQRKKEVVLGNIQDLDFEYKCGKLSDDDYKKVRGEMSAEAGAVFRQIELGLESAERALVLHFYRPRPTHAEDRLIARAAQLQAFELLQILDRR